jgi:DNA processing protein
VTVAVLAGGLDDVYPARHQQLAADIIAQGGALVSEYPPGTPPYREHFIARNRIVSGLSHAVLITEAAEKSGTLHTARFALEQGRDVLAVPGNITNVNAVGTNRLIKTGAGLVTSAEDILHVLGIAATTKKAVPIGTTPEEQLLITILQSGQMDGAALQEASELALPIFNQTLTMLEITGKIRSLSNNVWTLD